MAKKVERKQAINALLYLSRYDLAGLLFALLNRHPEMQDVLAEVWDDVVGVSPDHIPRSTKAELPQVLQRRFDEHLNRIMRGDGTVAEQERDFHRDVIVPLHVLSSVYSDLDPPQYAITRAAAMLNSAHAQYQGGSSL